jgi:hypothetical protein
MRSVAEQTQHRLLDIENTIDEIGDRYRVGIAHSLVFERARDRRRDVELIMKIHLFKLAEQTVESLQSDARAVVSK